MVVVVVVVAVVVVVLVRADDVTHVFVQIRQLMRQQVHVIMGVMSLWT